MLMNALWSNTNGFRGEQTAHLKKIQSMNMSTTPTQHPLYFEVPDTRYLLILIDGAYSLNLILTYWLFVIIDSFQSNFIDS